MFKSMTVGMRLLSGFLLLAIAGAIVAMVGILSMGKINDKAEELYKRELRGLSYIKEANISMIYIGRARGNVLLATSDEERKQHTEAINKYFTNLRADLERAKPLFTTPAAQELFSSYDRMVTQYEAAQNRVIALSAEESLMSRSQTLSDAMEETRRHADELNRIMHSLSEQKEERAKEAADETMELYHESRLLMIILVVLSALGGMVLGVFITRSLTRELGGEPSYAAQVAGKIADGDLSSPINLRANDRSSLLFAIKGMRDNLVGIVAQVRDGTETIATATGQIAAGSQDLSSRTEEQASSLEETASSMEQLTATVKQNAENARQANGLASSASDVATKGGSAVAEVVSTMGAINDSSKKIADIIGVIDGIAFQTNILALNAAVEAARAGEQGRGFAVVATEVRSLAQRSAAAAKEIKSLIDDSVDKVGLGARLVDQAGATMQEIVTSVRRVADIMGEIQAASDEQTAGIEQVNRAIAQMDEVTQQNASLVEESAAASEAMQEQAAGLASVVSVFKLDSSQIAAGGAVRAARHTESRNAKASTSGGRSVRQSAGRRAVSTLPPSAATARALAPTHSDEWEQF